MTTSRKKQKKPKAKKKAKREAVKPGAASAAGKRKPKDAVLVLKTVAVSPGKIDADVREVVGHVTGVSDFTETISTIYIAKDLWVSDGKKIEFRLVDKHGYGAFALSRLEIGKHYNEPFSTFINFCRDKIRGDNGGDKTDRTGPHFNPRIKTRIKP